MSVVFEFNHDIDTVFQLLTDPEFLVERSDVLGDKNCEAEAEEYEDGETVVTISRVMDLDVPAFAAKFLGDSQSTTTTETWSPVGDGWEGNAETKVKGAPVEVSATFSLKPSKSGCTYKIVHDCKVKIPLAGGKIKKIAQTKAVEDATKELQVAADKLG